MRKSMDLQIKGKEEKNVSFIFVKLKEWERINRFERNDVMIWTSLHA